MHRRLRELLEPQDREQGRNAMPSWLLRLAAIRNRKVRGPVPLLCMDLNATSAKAKRLLGWEPRSREDAMVAAAEAS